MSRSTCLPMGEEGDTLDVGRTLMGWGWELDNRQGVEHQHPPLSS